MKKLIVANWKMYLGLRESVALAKRVSGIRSQVAGVDIVLCPSFVALEEVAKVLRGTRIKLGAQDVEPVHRGAFTGEVGLDDLRSLHVEYVLVGHSERRRYFGETDAVVNRKLRAVLKAGMRPILCVGESWSVRRRGMEKVHRYVGNQVRRGLYGVPKKDLQRVVIAYEPVWAIGTGRPDSPEDAGKMHEWIRKAVGEVVGRGLVPRRDGMNPRTGGRGPSAPEQSSVRGRQAPALQVSVPILYGGSVSSKNAAEYVCAPYIDGLLVGHASTMAREFLAIMGAVKINK